ncbi:hypothetical protein [Psychrobacter sp. CAL346-MNA-CIBAN-0220]
MSYTIHFEFYSGSRNNWLRAAILGANENLISTARLLVGLSETTP